MNFHEKKVKVLIILIDCDWDEAKNLRNVYFSHIEANSTAVGTAYVNFTFFRILAHYANAIYKYISDPCLTEYF